MKKVNLHSITKEFIPCHNSNIGKLGQSVINSNIVKLGQSVINSNIVQLGQSVVSLCLSKIKCSFIHNITV